MGFHKAVPSAAFIEQFLRYDPETGRFTRGGARAYKVGTDPCRLVETGYLMIHLDGSYYFAHVIAWVMSKGALPVEVIDHINGIKSDNRICNLRDVPEHINSHNRTKAARNNLSCGYLGVTRRSDRRGDAFQARLTVKGRPGIYLGTFSTAEEAHSAYVKAKQELVPGWSA